MSFYAIGINHKTAPIEIREKFFYTPLEQEWLLSELKSHPAIVEVFVLSTCNRTELYLKALSGEELTTEILKKLAEIKNFKLTETLKKYFYVFQESEAVVHLLRVTCGLDSLVLGEKEILGQVKSAVELSRKKGLLGKYLNILSNCVIRAGKKVQSNTAISFGGASVSWAAVTMAERLLETLKYKAVLIIGAGKMGERTLEILKQKGAGPIYVMNRTQENACALTSRLGGEAVSFCDIREILTRVDLCLCSVGAPHYILDRDLLERVVVSRGDRKLVLIDISMPRNIDPAIAALSPVDLFHIDDLDQLVEATLKRRQEAVPEVERIIDAKKREFARKIQKINLLSSSEYFQSV